MIQDNQPIFSSTSTPQEVNFTDLAGFQDKQLEAWFTLLDPQCKYLLYGGAASGGKSYFLHWALIGLGMYYFKKYGYKNVPIGLFSADYPTLKDRQVIKMKNEIPSFLGKLVESRDEGYAFIGAKEYGSFLILLRNLDDPSKYKSAEFAAIGVEELTENKESTFDDLRFRMRYKDIEEVKFLGATNPGSVGHGWVKRKWVQPDPIASDEEQNRFFFVPARYDDNKYTTPEYVKQLNSLPENKRKAWRDGSWSVFAGQYFSEWNDSLHTVLPFQLTPGSVILGGMDWGYNAPFALVLTECKKVYYKEITFWRARTFLEVYGTERTPREWAPIIEKALSDYGITWEDITWIQADPAMFNKSTDGSISIRDQFIKAGEGFRKLKPASNDRIPGWQNLHSWLSLAPDGLPYWQVSMNCENLIRTFPELIHDDLKIEDVNTDRKGGIDDDLGDAIRYQFKGFKFEPGKVGEVLHTTPQRTRPRSALIDQKTGREISVNLGAFESSRRPQKSWWG